MRSRFLSTSIGTVLLATVALTASLAPQPKPRHNKIVELLARNQVVFGWFSTARTPDAAKKAIGDGQMAVSYTHLTLPTTERV